MKNKKVITEKPLDFNNSLKRLFEKIGVYKKYIISSIIFSSFGTILTIVGPNQLTKIIDEITNNLMGNINTNYVLKISVMLFILYILSFIFSYLQGFLMSTATQKYAKDLRKEISIKLNKLPLKFFDKNKSGDILSIISNDVDTMASSLNQSIGSLLSAIITLIGVTIMMFYTNVTMSITAVLASITGFLFIGIILSKSQKYFENQQKGLGKLNSHVEEIYSSFDIVKAYNGVDDSINEFEKLNNNLYHNARMSQFLSGLMMPLMNFVGNFGYVAVTVVGAYLVIEGYITFGVIVAYMIYIRLFTNPLSTIAQSFTSLQLVVAASERIYNFLEENEENTFEVLNKLENKSTKGKVEFKNVVFGYDKNKTIIKNFNASVKPGQTVAIVGPTGAGKTTLVNLLMRFYELNSGHILIDDIDIKSLAKNNIHNIFCMVLQDTWLYDDTILNNIKFNNEKVKKEDVIKVCKDIGIDHLIKTLPNSYNTILSEADNLSSGEKQLLTIARAMLKDASLLILDEATSNIDTRTELLVQNAMNKLMINKTSFIIAHRLSTIKNADLILVLKDGNIIEQGNHNELIKEKGFYSELYNSQFEE